MVGAWSSGGNLNTARRHIGGCGTQTAGLSFGGQDSTLAYSKVTEEYNGSSWSNGGSLTSYYTYFSGCGTQTAGLCFGASVRAYTFEYNGTSWSSGGNEINPHTYCGGCGTQTSGLSFGGGGYSNKTDEYNGTSWSSGGDLSIGKYRMAGAGTQSSGLCFGGLVSNAAIKTTEEYNGTTWSAGGDLANAKQYLGGCGTQTAGVAFGGNGGYSTTEEYNGSSWSSTGNLNTGRATLAGCGTQTAGLSFGGEDSSYSAVTEEYSPTLSTVGTVILNSKTPVSMSVSAIVSGGDITARGFCYKLASSAGDPTTSDSKVTDTGSYSGGIYTKTISSLSQGETYKVRPYIIDTATTIYGTTTEIILYNFLNPTYVYSNDSNYATISSTDGKLDLSLSVNNGSTFTSIKTATLPTGSGSEDSIVTGENGETWGLSIDGDDLDDGNLVVRVALNSSPTDNTQDYKEFSFTVSSAYRITGIEVLTRGYWDSSEDIIYLNWLAVRVWYGNTPTPVTEGSMAYASDGRKNGETAGNGSGVAVFWDGNDWTAVDTGADVDD